jgi:NAD(P)-dependent dehydrogenase (short-subunit alcohol dehydrogenase family)
MNPPKSRSVLVIDLDDPGVQRTADEIRAMGRRALTMRCDVSSPDDIRGQSVFLASDDSAWITGALIPMEGGNLAMNAGGSRRYVG